MEVLFQLILQIEMMHGPKLPGDTFHRSRTSQQKPKASLPKPRSQLTVIVSTFMNVCPAPATAPAPLPASGKAVTDQTALDLLKMSVTFQQGVFQG